MRERKRGTLPILNNSHFSNKNDLPLQKTHRSVNGLVEDSKRAYFVLVT